MISIKNRVRAGALALAVGATAVIGTAAAAAPAEARVASGCYTWSQNSTAGHHVFKVRVGHGKIRFTHTNQVYNIVPTRSGGYFDMWPSRFGLNKAARGSYKGQIWVMGIPNGNIKMTPRRC